MSNSARMNFNQAIIDEFRANGGVVSAPAGKPLILLTTTGAKSGQEPSQSRIVHHGW